MIRFFTFPEKQLAFLANQFTQVTNYYHVHGDQLNIYSLFSRSLNTRTILEIQNLE